MDWNGFLLPLLHAWLPKIPEAVLLAIIGLLVSLATALWKPKIPVTTMAAQKAGPPPARPLIVLAPAVVGGILAGPLGLIAPALLDGIRRAAWTLIRWVMEKFGIGGKSG
jgi:hypothetical protein